MGQPLQKSAHGLILGPSHDGNPIRDARNVELRARRDGASVRRPLGFLLRRQAQEPIGVSIGAQRVVDSPGDWPQLFRPSRVSVGDSAHLVARSERRFSPSCSNTRFSRMCLTLNGCSRYQMLRPYCLHHRELLGALARLAYETAREMMDAAVDEPDARPGMVVLA